MPQTAEKIEFLEKRAQEAPEYREVLSVFKEIFSTISGREGDTGISFHPPGTHGGERIRNGFPLVGREDLQVDSEAAGRFIGTMIDVVLRVGREGAESLSAMKKTLQEGGYDLPALLRSCFSRERKPIEEAAQTSGVPSPLLEFIFSTALKTSLECFSETVDPACVERWKEPYCPICGGRAGMAELAGEEGRRLLSCSACFFKWPYTRIKCPYCGTDDQDSLSYFRVGEEATRVDVCRKCSRYIKTRDSRKGNPEVPLEAEDLVTLHLDLLAVREGFERGNR